MARLASQINQYQTNNNGRIPGNKTASTCTPTGTSYKDIPTGTTNAACDFLRNYMNPANAQGDDESEFVDPSGDPYVLVIEDGTSGKTLDNSDFGKRNVYLLYNAKCNGEVAVKSGNSRDYAIMYKMEGSGTYCKDSQ